MAQQVAAGQPVPAEFAEAAAIEGVNAQELAATILAKPDDVMQRANTRRKAVLAVRAAKTPAELDSVLEQNGVPKDQSVLT
jgi:hypothetical protein